MPHFEHVIAAAILDMVVNAGVTIMLVAATVVRAVAVAAVGMGVGVIALLVLVSLRLQDWMPSNHVCSKLELPHLLNQAPPGAQQLRLPDFL